MKPQATAASFRRRLYSGLLAVGASFLLGRCLVLLAGGAFQIHPPWVVALLLAEMALDAAALGACLLWWRQDSARRQRLVLRVAAAVTVVHAVRVLVFVLGRTGPWIDFDVHPEFRAGHAERWTWGGVWFAAVASALSLVVLVWIWNRRRGAAAA